jgi:DNA-binding CsgD family transcriptional regulator
MLMEPLEMTRPIDISHFAQAHRLTPAEARALSGIVSGKTTFEIADEAACRGRRSGHR